MSLRRSKKMKIIKIKRGEESDSSAVDIEDDPPTPNKLKSPTPELRGSKPVQTKPQPLKKKKRGRDSGTSSEEERWLDAIESGKLEDVDDEWKKIKPKDPKLMTARQRAMYERSGDKDSGELLMSLPSGYKEKVMTEEAMQKAAIKSQKRKQLADEKREKDKKRTMERLLKKQDAKANKSTKTKANAKKNAPCVRYVQGIDRTYLAFPDGMKCPLEKKEPIVVPPVVPCGVCGKAKKYSCSKTNVPLCSFQCYKINLGHVKG